VNKTKIEWTDMTWNPVTGCLHRCPYCYANRQAERFSGYDPLYNTNFDFESGCYIIKKPMYKRDATGRRKQKRGVADSKKGGSGQQKGG